MFGDKFLLSTSPVQDFAQVYIYIYIYVGEDITRWIRLQRRCRDGQRKFRIFSHVQTKDDCRRIRMKFPLSEKNVIGITKHNYYINNIQLLASKGGRNKCSKQSRKHANVRYCSLLLLLKLTRGKSKGKTREICTNIPCHCIDDWSCSAGSRRSLGNATKKKTGGENKY